MADSVFTKMATGEIKAPFLYEDGLTFAILTHEPLSYGHALVIPKRQIDQLDDCPDELYAAIFETVHKVSLHLRDKLSPRRMGIVVHGLEVPHAHIHIVPLHEGDEMRNIAKSRLSETEISEQTDKLRLPDVNRQV
jgi:histidine triad (HIT) family protein